MTLPPTIDPRVLVSFSGDGTFDGEWDDVTNDTLADPGITVTHGRQDGLALSPPRVSDGGMELHNEDGTYSQERPDSPVYQRVLPGRPVFYTATTGTEGLYTDDGLYTEDDMYDGVGTFGLGRHVIRDIAQTTEIGNRRVALTTLGYETVLTRAKVTVGVMVTPLVSECFTALLDAVSWPEDKRSIAVSDTRLLYWWCDERAPWDAMLELLASEGPGLFWVDREGMFRFENRNYRATALRSTTVQATFYDRVDAVSDPYTEDDLYTADDTYPGVTSGLWFTGLTYDPGFANIRNRATYSVTRRTLGQVAVVWSYGADFDLSSGQSRTLIARPPDPFQGAVTPTLTTDFTVTGAGTLSVSLSATSGLVAFITVTAVGGDVTVSGFQLRAQPLTVVSETYVENSLDAAESIAKYSPVPGENVPITHDVQGWPEIDVPNAEAVCNAWVQRLQELHPSVTIALRNADGLHMDQILRRMPSDRLTLIEANTGMDADVWINSTELRLSGPGGRVAECLLSCERVEGVTGSVWDGPSSLWDTAVWGI